MRRMDASALTIHGPYSYSAASTTAVAALRREDQQSCTVAARLSFGRPVAVAFFSAAAR